MIDKDSIQIELTIKEIYLQGPDNTSVQVETVLNSVLLDQTNKPARLHHNHCLIYHTAQLTVHKHRQIELIVYTLSGEGKVIAGKTSFDPLLESHEKQWELPIDPDKPTQRIIFSTYYEPAINKSKSSGAQLAQMYYGPTETQAAMKSSQVERGFKPRQMPYHQPSRPTNVNKTKKLTHVKSNPSHPYHQPVKSPRINGVRSPKGKVEEEMSTFKRKLQEERAQRVRSISKLKLELNPNLRNGSPAKQDPDTAHLKQKIRILERKERNNHTTIEELTSELEKIKNRLRQVEKQKDQLYQTVTDKDIKIRSHQASLRTLQEQVETLSSKEKVVSRKGEAKEGLYRDQVKRLEEKLKKAQTELNEALEQKNIAINLKTQMEAKQQTSLKERDGKYLEAKAFTLKKEEEWGRLEAKYNDQLQRLTSDLQDTQRTKSRLQERVQELQMAIMKYEKDAEEMRQRMKSEKDRLQRTTEQSVQTIHEEVLILRRKYNEVTTSMTSLQQHTKALEMTSAERQQQVHDLEMTIKNKNSQIGRHTTKINSLKRQNEELKEEEVRRDRQLNALQKIHGEAMAKLHEMREKLDGERGRRQEIQMELERQAVIFSQRKDSFDSQIKDMRWTLLQKDEELREREGVTRQANEKNLQLSHELMAKSQRQSSLEEQLSSLQRQLDHTAQQRSMLQHQLRQTNEQWNRTREDLQQHKNASERLEHKLSGEQERNSHLLLSMKERQQEEESRAKQREAQLRKKEQESQRLELECMKRQEELTIARNQAEIALRQMELIQMDSDTANSQHNLLQAAHKQLNADYETLTGVQQAATTQITQLTDNNALLMKKNEFLQKELNEYRTSVEEAMRNLANELYRQVEDTNIVATALRPFPDQTLSTLQIELVQKRNNHIIRQKQQLTAARADRQQLQAQLVCLRQESEQAQQQQHQEYENQKERLKAMLYEHMVEISTINEQLSQEKQLREHLQREVEGLKVELSKREESDQQLNGQLQMLLLEYEAVKDNNQQANQKLFAQKEDMIKTHAQHQQVIFNAEEAHSTAMEALKSQHSQIQQQMITVEQQLLVSKQKLKISQESRREMERDAQQRKEVAHQAELAINNARSEITQLHNTIRDHQKAQQQLKMHNEQVEKQLGETQRRAETLNLNSDRNKEEAMSLAVEKEKVVAMLAAVEERLQESEKLWQHKGEISKERMQQKMQQNSQLKAKIIEQQSTIEMTQFYLQQKKQNFKALQDDHEQLQKVNDLTQLKIKQFAQLKDQMQANARQMGRQIEALYKERDQKDQIISQTNFVVLNQQADLEQAAKTQEELKYQQQQCLRLKKQQTEIQGHYRLQVRDLKQKIAEYKQEMMMERETFQNERSTLQHRQQQNEAHSSEQLEYLQIEYEREKGDFERRVKEIETHNNRVLRDMDDKLDRIREELVDSREAEKAWADEAAKKESIITSLKKQILQIESELQAHKHESNKQRMLSQQSKLQMQRTSQNLQQTMKNSLTELRMTSQRQTKQRVAEVLRKVDRLRHTQQMELGIQPMSRADIKKMLGRVFVGVTAIVKDVDGRQSKDDSFYDD